MKLKYKLLLFDLDDTLIDYSRTEHEALELVYKSNFQKITEFEYFLKEFTNINRSLWEKFRENQITLSYLRQARFKKLNDRLNSNVSISTLAKEYETYLASKVYPFDDTVATLIHLEKKYILSLLSNGISSIQNKKVEKLGIKELFSHITISEDIGTHKPAAEFYLYALRIAKVRPSESLMIGDSPESDLMGSVNASIDFCWINRHNLKLPEKFPKPHLIIHNLNELKSYL